jgi:hypothetical protein
MSQFSFIVLMFLIDFWDEHSLCAKAVWNKAARNNFCYACLSLYRGKGRSTFQNGAVLNSCYSCSSGDGIFQV